MVTTPNKGLTEPAQGSPNWDEPLNANFGIIDAALGGVTTLDVTGKGSSPIDLLPEEYQNLIIKITGVLTANVTYRVPAGVGGQWTVDNQSTTSTSNTLKISGAGTGTFVTLKSGERRIIYADGGATNNNVKFSDNALPTVGAIGEVAYSDGSSIAFSPNFKYDGTSLLVQNEISTTNDVAELIRLTTSSSVTPAVGIGGSIRYDMEVRADVVKDGGYLSVFATDVASGTEDFSFSVDLMRAGTYPSTSVLVLTSTGAMTLAGNAVITAGQSTATQSLTTAGIVATFDDDGSLSTGSYTPTPIGGNFKKVAITGNITINAPTATGSYTIIVQITATSGTPTVTLSGFTKTSGYPLTSLASGSKYMIYITKLDTTTFANVVALQ